MCESVEQQQCLSHGGRLVLHRREEAGSGGKVLAGVTLRRLRACQPFDFASFTKVYFIFSQVLLDFIIRI